MDRFTIRSLSLDEITDGLLRNFVRRQVSNQWYRRQGDDLVLVPERFVDDWDQVQKQSKLSDMRRCLSLGGALIGALHGDELVGFVLLEGRKQNNCLEISKLHVSLPVRRQGLGRLLFQAACQEGRRRGASRLFLSTGPARDTQQFYRAMGCEDGRLFLPLFSLEDPTDLPLQFSL